MDIDLNDINNKLIESIKLLAADYYIQKTSLPDYVNTADEVALIFDELILFIEKLESENIISQNQKDKIFELNDYLDTLSDTESFWNDKALKSSSEWAIVRQKAKEILKLMRIDESPPNLFWLDFISQ